MLRVVEAGETLEIQDRMSSKKRSLLFLFSLLPLYTISQVVSFTGEHHSLNSLSIAGVTLSVFMLILSGWAVCSVLVGLNSLIYLDKRENKFTIIGEAFFVPIRKIEYPLSSITSCRTETREGIRGGSNSQLLIEISNERRFLVGSAWSRSEAEEVRARIESYLGWSG